MLIGAVIGAALGTAYGYHIMSTTDDYLAPPAYLITAPAGALLGLLVGAVVS